ncbi:hypothetical protein FRB93_004416 [Tulasnella sp. JGI-2019a]|nr:hypothetical protein FRB93_004416 [Tulasnella sp. JGI-2019a]
MMPRIVCLSSQPTGSLALPAEILDRVIFYIISLRDLLALALTNSALHGAIIDDHLPYRCVECHITDDWIWSHLLQVSQRKIENVRLLRIDDFTTETVPPRSRAKVKGSTQEKPPPSMLTNVLKRTSNLESVLWSRHQTLGLFGKTSIGPDAFWVALREHCFNLRELHVECSVDCSHCSVTPERWAPSKMFELGGLRSLSLKLSCNNRVTHFYDLKPLCGMLSRCPDLLDLSLSTSDPVRLVLDVTLLTYCRLPRLKHLFLNQPHFAQGHDFYRFLEAHPALRTLSMPHATFQGQAEGTVVFNNIFQLLPNLRNLCGGPYVVGGLLFPLPTGRRRPLVYVNLVDEGIWPIGRDTENHEEWMGLLMDEVTRTSTLRSLRLEVHLGERQLAPRLSGCESIRRLEVICLGLQVWDDHVGTDIPNHSVAEMIFWTESIRHFGNLEVLVMDAGLALALRFLSMTETRESFTRLRSNNTVSAVAISPKTIAIQHVLEACPHLHSIVMKPGVGCSVKIAPVGEQVLPSCFPDPPLAWGVINGKYWILEQMRSDERNRVLSRVRDAAIIL